MKERYSLLSKKEKEKIINSLVSDESLVTDFTLNIDEIKRIKKFDRAYVSLGYALQYIFLKNRKISILNIHDKIPTSIINYISEQLKCSSKELYKYWDIKNTKLRHFKEISNEFDFTKFNFNDENKSILHSIIWTTDNKYIIVRDFIEEMKANKVLIPKLSSIETIVSQEISNINTSIHKNVYNQIEDLSKLDNILSIEKNGISTFSRIKNISVNVSSNGVKELLKLIKEIDSYGNLIDLSFLNENKIRYLYTKVLRYNKFKLERLDDYKKYSYLAMFLYFKRKDFTDMVIEVTSNHVHEIQKRSKRKMQEYKIKNQYIDRENSDKLKLIVKEILNLKSSEELEIYKSKLRELDKELDLQKNDLDEIDFLLKSYQSVDYINSLLEVIEFDSNVKPELIDYIKSVNYKKSKVNKGSDISFFDSKWQKNIKKYEYSKKIVNMAVAYTLRDGIRSGDLFVRESKKYNSFDYYLIDPINNLDESDAIAFFDNLRNTINIPHSFKINRDIEQDEKSTLSKRIYSYFPRISMSEIIYEVNQWTNFLDDFKGMYQRETDNQKIIIASLLADGHNIGFFKMSIASSIDEYILRNASEFYLNYENLSRAQKTLVNYHHSLEIVKNWGHGRNSSSDGMRVPISSKTIYADYNGHYKNRGGGIYRHVSDQYTPYYVQILEGRDSNHVLDGLLYHDTNLDIYDHSTDTAGYTEQMFALTYLLGFNFKPRIKNLTQQQLYAFESFEMEEIKIKKINEKTILDNYSEVMRLVESIKNGKVKASLILHKINSYNRDNGVAKGLKEIGRILKTKYIIDYYTDETLRKEVQKMLNKGEAINSVARLIFFGKQGRLNESKIERQLEKVSCLNILLSALIIWNSRYLEKVYKEIKNEPWFDEDEFKRVSPLGTQHVNFLGRYIFEESNISTTDGLRELYFKSE
ncbi:MAG: Tn3 family transposase [Romboutsia sp.]|uniref:Tn3 family transposase n=1 Tax=Romboutsia sp. TaxID=1965302 RepID=UPI003F2A68DE